MKQIWLTNKYKIITVILAVLVVSFIPNIGHAVDTIQQKLDIIKEVMQLVSQYHIEDVDEEELLQGAIDGMLEKLGDPYTTYFTDDEFESFKNSINGSYKGIGIYIEEKDGYIIVQSPIPDSPAEKAGLQSGDAIIAVDGVDIIGKTTQEAANLIKGEEGTKVTLTIKRGEQTLTKEVERAQIFLPIIESDMLSQDIGYLRLYSFSEQSAVEFKQHLSQLKEQGMNKLILDLRSNPGGYLNAVLEISKNFIDQGPIVHIRYKDQQEEALSIEGGASWDFPLVVLINQGSASASEILASALQDYQKAVIIGETSFGKGTVQRLISLENGGYLKLTVNEYFTPNKHKINGIGVKPDIEVIEPSRQIPAALAAVTEKELYTPDLGKDWIQAGGKDYIAIRTMVEKLGGKITWNSQYRGIEIYLGGVKSPFITEDTEGFMLKNGTSYLDINQLQEIFPEIIILYDEKTMTIFYP